jgi:WD40 repeat protein
LPEQELAESHPGAGPGGGHGAAALKQQHKPEYDAFLSYSHAADDRLAPAVQQGLHQLAKPWYRMRALRVFRDQLSLSANPDLWATITDALQDSRFFILMASPRAAASWGVQREVEYWQAHRERTTFLIVLTDGTIAWDQTTRDFDWARTTALPPQLCGWFSAEPLWVQLGWAHSDTHLSVRHNRFRDAIATLAAPIHGIAKDDLDSEDVRQHRLTTRVRNGGIAVLTLLTVVSLVLGVIARQQAHQAQTALQRAVSRELSTRSQALGDTDPAVSKLLSVAAWRLDPTPDSRAAMIAAFNRPGIAVFPDGGGPVALSPDRCILATGDANGTVRLWDAVSHKPIGVPLAGHTGFVGTVKFSPDGATLATGSADGTVQLWDTVSHRRIGDPLIRNNGVIRAVTFSRDGGMLATGSGNGTVRLWDTASHRQIGDSFQGYSTGSVSFSPDRHALAFFSKDGTVRLWDIASHTQIGAPLTGFTGAVVAVAFSPDGGMLATGGYDGEVRWWNVASHTQVGDALSGGTGIVSSAFSPDGGTLATSSDSGTVRLWDLASHNQHGTPLTNGGDGGFSAVFSPDGHTLRIMRKPP